MILYSLCDIEKIVIVLQVTLFLLRQDYFFLYIYLGKRFQLQQMLSQIQHIENENLQFIS